MPRLKCVGGTLDGHEFHVDSALGPGDAVILPDLTSPPASIDYYAGYCAPEVVDNQQHTYVIDRLCGTERDTRTGQYVPFDIVRFLRPIDMTSAQAVQHQFRK